MSVIHRKLTFLARFLLERFMALSFLKEILLRNSYPEMLQDLLLPQLIEDSEDFIFQQDGAPPHWHNQVRQFLNETLPQRWIERTGPKGLTLHSWLPRSPDMTPCDFFLWVY